jgi:feruloyl esterase
MKKSKHFITCVFGLSIMLFIFTVPAFGVWTPPTVDYGAKGIANQANCEALQGYLAGLTDATFHKPVTNVTATWKTATSGATFCQVVGWMWPEIKFQVTMPTVWNERYQMNGGGGWDGSLSTPNSPNAQGYATSSANGGYMSANWSGTATFGLKEPYFSEYWNSPTAIYPKAGSGGYYAYPDAASYVAQGNPDACQKVVDYGYRFLYETPVIAKKIVKHYYGIDPKKSYYSGGSNGGKEGQITAQKFPELFDGYYIGCPLGGMVAVTFRGTWDTFWGEELAKKADPSCTGFGCQSVYAKYKAALHYQNVYGKCDGVDGLVDGLIDDPRRCKFDALTDLPACSPEEEAAEGVDGVYSSTCFTLAQRQALKEIYAGPHNSKGKAWYPGQPLGAEYLTRGTSSGFGSALADGMAPPMFANIALDPPDGPNFDIKKFNWDKDPKAMERTTCEQCYEDGSCETFNIQDTLDGITISPRPAPNMGGFEGVYAKSAKIVQHHGWGDSLVTALAASVGLYETALETMGVEKTKSFWKLYVVPGAGHCGGGIATAYPNAFDVMVDWVENDNEPAGLTGSRAAGIDASYPDARTGLSCPYPEVARWNGSLADGGINNAANYSCVPPVNVKIEPETLNLRSKGGVFTAKISVPEGYNIQDWNIHNVSCEGAPAVDGKIAGDKYIAKFNRQDLKNVLPGQAVTLTVKLAFHHDVNEALTQASDTVKVIK